jgi:hypothetical protein
MADHDQQYLIELDGNRNSAQLHKVATPSDFIVCPFN